MCNAVLFLCELDGILQLWQLVHGRHRSKGCHYLVWWCRGGVGPHRMSTLVVGPHSSWSYPQSWSDVVEIGLVKLLGRPPLEVNFMGGVSWSSQQLVFLLNSGRGEEIGVHGTDTGGHDTGLVPSPVLGTGEICIGVLRDKETERFLCGLRLSLHALVSFHAPLHDSSGDSRESIGGHGCTPYPSCQESIGAKCAIRSWEANSSSWG